MLRKLLMTAALASAVIVGTTTPVLAHDRDDDERGYYRDDDAYRHEYRETHYRRYDGGYESYESRRVEYQPRYDDYRNAPPPPRYRRQRCGSGTTGAILGGVVGGLLGREVGRGGPWNEPSTTGLIVGAGAGALAGRAIERDGCR